ncbi:MAG: hypothetical protein R2850_01470 [Bacteroidia bacterium]
MIVFYLVSNSEENTSRACELILNAGFAHQVFADHAVDSFRVIEGMIQQEELIRLIFLTKAMLFDDIERLLSQEIPEHDFRIYSTPVTQVDGATGKAIRERLPDGIQSSVTPTNPS